MKEFKTFRVSPEEENDVVTLYSRFGWVLEDSREVYNESQEIVGVNQKVTSYGAYMRGFTGNDGKVETEVQTRTNVTHYITLRFSRETSIEGYGKLVNLENAFMNAEEPAYRPHVKPVKNSPPIIVTVVAAIAIIVVIISLLQATAGVEGELWEYVVCAVVGVAAVLAIIISWVLYVKNKAKKAARNSEIFKENEEIDEENARLKKEYNDGLLEILNAADEILTTK